MQMLLRSDPRPPAAASAQLREAVHAAGLGLQAVGFTCLQEWIPAARVAELCAEALRLRDGAQTVSRDNGEGYRARLAGLGAAGRAFLSGDDMTALMGALFDVPLAPDMRASCYTYYGPGDFLGAHVDHPEQCLVTAIAYLHVIRPKRAGTRTGLELHILEGDPAIERRAPRAVLPTSAGALVLGLGSVHWHARPPLQDGEHLAAMTACYSRLASA